MAGLEDVMNILNDYVVKERNEKKERGICSRTKKLMLRDTWSDFFWTDTVSNMAASLSCFCFVTTLRSSCWQLSIEKVEWVEWYFFLLRSQQLLIHNIRNNWSAVEDIIVIHVRLLCGWLSHFPSSSTSWNLLGKGFKTSHFSFGTDI